MTDEDLKIIEERAAKATAGPWTASHREPKRNPRSFVLTSEPRGRIQIACLWDSPNASCLDDAAFIAASRYDVPALVAEVRRLQRIIDEDNTLVAKIHARSFLGE